MIMSMEENSSFVPDGGHPADLPVIGLGGSGFHAIHLAALTVLSVSTSVSFGLLCYLCCCSQRRTRRRGGDVDIQKPFQKNCTSVTSSSLTDINNGGVKFNILTREKSEYVNSRKQASSASFWKWNVGERLVVYLAICDFGMGVSHILDHAYMYHVRGHPPDVACTVMALFLQEFAFSQWIVVLFTAVSACVLVVLDKKLELGRWDYRLLLSAFGGSFAVGVIGANFNLLGQSGAWCHIDLRHPAGRMYNKCVAVIQIFSFLVISVAYAAIWIKISRTARHVDRIDYYWNTAKIMMIFVTVFIFQWGTLVMSHIWFLFATPPSWMIVLTVGIVNMGGVYNFVAYTIIRRRLLRQTREITRKVTLKADNSTASLPSLV